MTTGKTIALAIRTFVSKLRDLYPLVISRTAGLKLLVSGPLLYSKKFLRTPKSICLCEIYLLIFTLLGINTRKFKLLQNNNNEPITFNISNVLLWRIIIFSKQKIIIFSAAKKLKSGIYLHFFISLMSSITGRAGSRICISLCFYLIHHVFSENFLCTFMRGWE